MHSLARRQSIVSPLLALSAVLLCSAIATADPPERVARLSFLSGPVSLRPATIDDWAVATINYPMTTGDNLWTDAAGRAEMQLGSSVVRLGPHTSLSILNLDNQITQLSLTQGSVSVSVRDIDMALGEVVEVDTPNGAVSLQEIGLYRIDVGTDGDQTTVTVRDGTANVATESTAFDIESNRSAVVTGLAEPRYSVQKAARNDEWEDWVQRREGRVENVMAQMYVSRDVIGYDDLDNAGTWETDATYGPIWIPHVSANWAPYRAGHWTWIEPWGWTWIDDAPWGFAPFHYGRWVTLRGGWAWVPDDIFTRPVYAPALVAFISSSANSAGIGEPVAWFPLGPREMFIPVYHVSPGYLHAINAAQEAAAEIESPQMTFVNRTVPGATTSVARDAFVHGRAVDQSGLKVATENGGTLSTVGHAALVIPEVASVLGQAAEGMAPPAAVLNRQVVMRTPPPPPAVPFAARQPALNAHPGQPVDEDTLRSLEAGIPMTTALPLLVPR